MPTDKICVIGLGYIALPSAAMLATNGFDVVGVDIDPHVVITVNSGSAHIEEAGLDTLVRAAVQSGRLVAKPEPEPADVFIIAVQTPLTDDKCADLEYVRRATESIVPHLRKGNLVVLESTVVPGTTTGLVAPILEGSGLLAGSDFDLAHCPERVMPGNILTELVNDDRIIGGVTPEASERVAAIYRRFVSGGLYLTDATTAELVKLAENAYRDVNIAFANELSNVAGNLGLDAWEVIRLANEHPRVNILRPGPGVGGHCISVDPWFLVQAQENATKLIRAAREVNDAQPLVVAGRIRELLAGVSNPRVAVLGVTYKADVDDTRESPALAVIEALMSWGYDVAVHDHHLDEFTLPLLPVEEAFAGADCAVVLAGHREFKELDPARLGPLMRTRHLLDTVDLLPHGRWADSGFAVHRLGAPDTPRSA